MSAYEDRFNADTTDTAKQAGSVVERLVRPIVEIRTGSKGHARESPDDGCYMCCFGDEYGCSECLFCKGCGLEIYEWYEVKGDYAKGFYKAVAMGCKVDVVSSENAEPREMEVTFFDENMDIHKLKLKA